MMCGTEAVEELRQRLLALGFEFAVPDEGASDEDAPDEGAPDEDAADNIEILTEPEGAALRLALRRALAFVRGFCNKLEWPPQLTDEAADGDKWPGEVWEAVLDLAAAYFLQAKMALEPESLAVMPTLTSLRLGDAAWSFGGGTQRSGTDALTRTEALAAELRRQARASLCSWRSI